MVEVELDGIGPLELDPVPREVVTHDAIPRRAAVVGRARDEERAVRDEDEQPVWAQETRRFRHPPVRVAPEARAVFRDRAVEARVLEVELLGIRAQQGKLDPELPLELGCGLKQRPGDVDSYRTEPAPREPRADGRSATSKLDDVRACLEAVDEP